PFATYLNVQFSIKPASSPNGNIYIAGAFNNWKVEHEYKLSESSGLYSLTLPLKRGIYDYQYVIAQETYDGEIYDTDWIQLEGNNWAATNEFTVLLYYNDPDFGGYNRVIGYKRFLIR